MDVDVDVEESIPINVVGVDVDGRVGKQHEDEDCDCDCCVEDGMSHFDVLCASVARRNHPTSSSVSLELRNLLDRDRDRHCSGLGVQRMWEGGLLDCYDDRDIFLRTTLFPSLTFGKNMAMAGFGSVMGQGAIHFMLGICGLLCIIAYGVTKSQSFLYVTMAVLISIAVYSGYFRSLMRSRFNIKGSDSPIDDCIRHLFCSHCALCQEARTLEMNNVQDGIWHGRGDLLVGGCREPPKTHTDMSSVITVSPEPCQMGKSEHSWSKYSEQSDLLVES